MNLLVYGWTVNPVIVQNPNRKKLQISAKDEKNGSTVEYRSAAEASWSAQLVLQL